MTPLGAVGSAKLRTAEIALVLDISGSMERPAPGAIVELRDSAMTFVSNFQSFQKDHQFALVYSATIPTTRLRRNAWPTSSRRRSNPPTA